MEWRLVASDLMAYQFWSPEFCKFLIEKAEAHGFSQDGTDPDYPTDQCWLKDALKEYPGVMREIFADMKRAVSRIIGDHWTDAADFHEFQDPFMVRFRSEGVRDLRLHNDWSEFSMWLRLNDDYEGGRLLFPRQNYEADIPVGTVLLWPGINTHPHMTTQMLRGVKYAVNFWTYDSARMKLLNSV